MKLTFKRYGVFIFLFFFSFMLNAQSSNIDSLKKVLSIAKNDSVKFWTLQTLRVSYTFSYPDTALLYAQQQILLARKHKNLQWKAIALDSKGLVLSVMGNYPEAMAYLLKALRVSEQITYDEWTFRIYSHLTNTTIDQGNFNQAIQYGFKCLEVAEKTRNGEYKFSALGQIGSIYEKLNQLDSALYYVQKSYDLEWQLKRKHEWNTLPYLLGNIYAKKSDYPAAAQYYHFAIQLAIKRNNVKALMNIYNGLATAYQKSGKLDSGIYYARKTIGVGPRIVNPIAILEASNLLADLYKSRNEKDSMIKYMELAAVTKDSLFNREKIIHVENISFDERLRRKEIEATKTAYRNKLKTYFFIGGLGGLLLIAAILLRNNRNKQKANELLQQQKREIEYQRTKAEEALQELRATQAQLVQQELLKSQIEIQEQTFKNVSQEIHDNIGQLLTLLKLNIHRMNLAKPEQLGSIIVESKPLISKAIEGLRDLSKLLSTDYINGIGLEKAIQQQLDLLQKAGSYTTQLMVKGDVCQLPSQRELVLFRIIQELLNNIVKHAEASSIFINMEYHQDLLEIRIQDDGKGFHEMPSEGTKNKGVGLYNIRNRVKLLQGTIDFECHPQAGTIVVIKLPR